MQINRNSSHKLTTNLSDFFYFNVLLHGIQDGFVFSFRKKDIFLFSVVKFWRLFEVIKNIFKK